MIASVQAEEEEGGERKEDGNLEANVISFPESCNYIIFIWCVVAEGVSSVLSVPSPVMDPRRYSLSEWPVQVEVDFTTLDLAWVRSITQRPISIKL